MIKKQEEPDYDLFQRVAGKWVLKEDIIGYKKVRCLCIDNSTIEQIWKDKIARVIIPKNAVVIRPYTRRYDANSNSIIKLATNMLRSDKMIIDKIYTQDQIVYATALINPKIIYHEQRMYSAYLDQDLSKTCTLGLHFFLRKDDAVFFHYLG